MMNKRIFAALVAMGMVASMGTMAVNASTPAEGVTGAASVEGIVDKEVLQVTLPTSTAVANIFDFKMDPQKLVATLTTTSSQVVTGQDGTLLFNQTSGSGTPSYKNTSMPIEISVANSIKADVAVKATFGTTSSKKFTFSSAADFGAAGVSGTEAQQAQAALDKKAHIYLEVQSTVTAGSATTTPGTAQETKKGVFTADGASVTDAVPALPEGCFELTKATDYAYTAKTSGITQNKVALTLTGKTNPDADWTGLASEALSIDYAWSIKKHVDAFLAETSISASDLKTNFSSSYNATNITVESATIYDKNGANSVSLIPQFCTVGTDGLTFGAACVGATYTGGKIDVVFKDKTTGTTKTETITIS